MSHYEKIISLVLVLVLALSITACDGSGTKGNSTETPTLNAEELKENWKDGELIFANNNGVKIPCTANDVVEASELEVYNSKNITVLTLAPNESKTIYLVNDETRIEITCKNITDENLNIMDATVVKYNFTNIKLGNRKIKFAGSLTPGVTRADVESVLEIPKDATSEDSLYFYSGRNSNNKKVEFRIGFNSDNIVSSVSFEVNA